MGIGAALTISRTPKSRRSAHRPGVPFALTSTGGDAPGVTIRNEVGAGADEVRWHRELPSPAHLGTIRDGGRGWNGSGRRSSPHTSVRDVRLAGWLHHQRRLSQVTFLLLRDGAGIAQVVVESDGDRDRLAAIQPESVLEVGGRVVANEQAPGGVELHDPTIVVLSATEAAPPFELRRPELSAQLPTLLDHAAVSLRHPRRRAAAAPGRGVGPRVPDRARRPPASPRSTRPRSSPRRPRAAPTCSRSTGSGGPPTWPRARSSTSRRWSACSSGCTRSPRCSGPSRTTPRGTSPSTCRWTPRSASSPTTPT